MKSEFEFWIEMKNILKRLGSISYEKTTNSEITLDSLKTHHIAMGKEWQVVSKWAKSGRTYRYPNDALVHRLVNNHANGETRYSSSC